jgi:hypothetical protein
MEPPFRSVLMRTFAINEKNDNDEKLKELRMQEYQKKISNPEIEHGLRLSNYNLEPKHIQENIEYVLNKCDINEKFIWILYHFRNDITRLLILLKQIDITYEMELELEQNNNDIYEFYINKIKMLVQEIIPK